MSDVVWWRTLKDGDKIRWSLGKWRYNGTIRRICRGGNSILVDDVERHISYDYFDEEYPGGKQKTQSLPEKVSLTADLLTSEDFEWTYRKTSDIRIRVKIEESEREFKIWGEGTGIPKKEQVNCGLMYLQQDKPYQS